VARGGWWAIVPEEGEDRLFFRAGVLEPLSFLLSVGEADELWWWRLREKSAVIILTLAEIGMQG
jgi:hypothetical protein